MNSSNTSYENNTLILSSGESYKFKYSIAEIKEFDDIVIVRLEIPPKVIHNENIYCISINGKLNWQIEKIDHVYENSPYTGMILNDDGLIIFNWDGLEAKINLKSGKIISKKFGK